MNPIEKRIAEVVNHLGLADGKITQAAAEEIVEQCCIKGLTVDDIIEGQAPQAIAERWMHHRLTARTEHAETDDCGKHYPLLPFSKVVHNDLLQHGSSERWCFPILLRVKADEVDATRLEHAVNHVLSHHPVFSMHIEEDGTHWHDPSYRSPYIKIGVKSEDGYVYLSLTLNRILGDATSFVLLAQNIWRAYRGEVLPQDGYLHYLGQHERLTHTQEYAEHARWLKQEYDAPDYPLLPKQDSPEGLLPCSTPTPVIAQPDYAEQLTAFSQRERISTNAFFCLTAALAIMDFNGTDEAGLTWAYMGRETREQMHIFGSLHRDIPMRLTRRAKGFAQLREQMQQGILHSDYPFTLLSPKDSAWHTAVNVLVQPSLAEAFEGCPVNFEPVPIEQPAESYCMLDIDITLAPLTLTFHYSPHHYTEHSIQRFAALIDQNARRLLGSFQENVPS